MNLKRVLLLVSALALVLLYVTVQQNLTIADQRAELVKQLQTLTASQMHEGKMIRDLDEQAKKFDEATKALPTCKK